MNPVVSAPDALIDAVASLRVPFGHERSFRLAPGELLSNRFLLSIARGALGPDANQRVLDLTARIAVPANFLHEISWLLPHSPFVHFGFEQDARFMTRKIYLEQPAPPNPTAPILLYQAFKWDTEDPSRQTTSRYTWHPMLSLEQICDRIEGMVPGSRAAVSILRQADSRRNGHLFRYMKVTDAFTSRRSWDVNLYQANLRVVDLASMLVDLAENFSIGASAIESFLRPIRTSLVGHIAGGTHRNGLPFFTLYHGAEQRR